VPRIAARAVGLDHPFARIARASLVADHLDLRPRPAVGCGPGRVA